MQVFRDFLCIACIYTKISYYLSLIFTGCTHFCVFANQESVLGAAELSEQNLVEIQEVNSMLL